MEIGHEAFLLSSSPQWRTVTDEDGLDFPDASAARREAEQSARQLLANAIKAGSNTVPGFHHRG
jgi:hypothetical protein